MTARWSQRHQRGLGEPGAQAAAGLGGLEVQAGRGGGDGLRLGAVAVQGEPARRVEAVGELDAALGADHRGGPHVAAAPRSRAWPPRRWRSRARCRCGRRCPPGAGDAQARTWVRRAEQQLREVDRVDAEVEQGAAAELRVAQPVRRVEVDAEPESGLHRGDLADRAVGDQLEHAQDAGQGAGPHRLHQEELALPGHRDQVLRLGEVERERLLDQQRLAGVQAEQRRPRGGASVAWRRR